MLLVTTACIHHRHGTFSEVRMLRSFYKMLVGLALIVMLGLSYACTILGR